MNEISFPTQSTNTLIRASIIAIITAFIIFITLILPAEYKIDPTGLGKVMGLTALAEESVLAEETEPSEKQISTQIEQTKSQSSIPYRDDRVTVTVPPNKGVEYKFKMHQYANLAYEWTTNGEPVFFDFHGEPKGDASGYFESYVIATNAEMKGSMTMPFEGGHGWYWKNNSDKEIIITLKTQGNYEVVGLKK